MLLALPTNIRLGWKGLPGTNTLGYLTFYIRILLMLVMLASVFVSGKPFQPSLIFLGKAGASPSKAPITLRLLLALPTNIRLGWKGLPETS